MKDPQLLQWENFFAEDPEMFGAEPSLAARIALGIFQQEGIRSILELGPGQGRDSLWFARRGLSVTCLDYSATALRQLHERSTNEGLADRIITAVHDLRKPLPLPDNSLEACFSHMLYCMDFTTGQLKALAAEIRRALKPGGLNIFTARHTGDPHFGKGADHGDNRFENSGFIVHFLSRKDISELNAGFELMDISELEEGELPRKLFLAVQKKISG